MMPIVEGRPDRVTDVPILGRRPRPNHHSQQGCTGFSHQDAHLESVEADHQHVPARFQELCRSMFRHA